MGICTSCLYREPTNKTVKRGTLEIKSFEFIGDENLYFQQNSHMETELKAHNLTPISSKNPEIKQVENITKKKSKKKKKKPKICKKKLPNYQKNDWTEDDEKVFNGLFQKYNGNQDVLINHFSSKKEHVLKKLRTKKFEKCKKEIDSEQLKKDYFDKNGNWNQITEKYKMDQSTLKQYFYSEIFPSILKTTYQIHSSKEENSSEICKNASLFEKEKYNNPISKNASFSDINDDDNILVEEKISYLSARKEILECMQTLLDEGDTEEEIEK